MSERYALLIGVDFYFEHALPDGSYFPSLGGCVRDIRHVEAYLTDPARMNLPRENLLMLTATDTRGDLPAEPPEQWPTYDNMVAKLKALSEMAKAGDQVYIQYSGHGGRATTLYPDLKGDTGVDEALVPLDIGDPQARYLRDVEMHYLFTEMVRKGLRLTVVFDCCNSGGATRGAGGARTRGISAIDTTPRPGESLVASYDRLTAAWQASTGGRMRATKPASGWLLEPRGYTFIAACRASESAFEYPFNGTENNGALTYWMLDTLRQNGPGLTYTTLHERVLAKVHGQFEQQTPMLQGEGNRPFFGSDSSRAFGEGEEVAPPYAVPVLQVDTPSRRVRVNAGEVHGITPGSQFAIYPFGAPELTSAEHRLALVEASQVNDVDSWATIVTQSNEGTLEVGAHAVLLQSANLRTRREIALVVEDAALKQQLEQAIAAQGKGFVAVATGKRTDFQVATNPGGEFELWDAAGAPLPNLRPSIRTDAPDALDRLVARLVHLAKFYNVRDITSPDANAASKLHVTLASLSGDAEQHAGGAPIFRPEEKIKLTVHNTQLPGAPNDPTRILNITVLDLAPDWSITQIFPAASAAFEPLDPQGTFEFEFEAFLPNSRSEGTDTFKVFATQSTTNFRWLQLPALDQPPIEDAAQRATISDPLEQLLASITGESMTTRDVRITSSPQTRGWTVAQTDLRVKA
jgi:hypothetical protein